MTISASNQYIDLPPLIIDSGKKFSTMLFEILERVRTYSIGRWLYTDDPLLDPFRLSSLGRVVNSEGEIECVTCHHKASLKGEDGKINCDLLSSLNQHKQNCMYSNQDAVTYTSEMIYLRMDEIAAQIKLNYSEMGQAKTYPLLNFEEVAKYHEREKFLFRAIAEGYNLPEDSLDICLDLVLFGWTFNNQDSTDPFLECLFCGKTCRFSMIQLTDSNIQKKSSESKSHEKAIFDPTKNHRYFCIWNNKGFKSESPQSSRVFYGWQIFIQYLYDKLFESKSLLSNRKPEETRKIRVELDKFLENFQMQTSEKLLKIQEIFEQCQNSKKFIEEQLAEQQAQNSNEGEPKTISFEDSKKRIKQFVDEISESLREPIKKIKL